MTSVLNVDTIADKAGTGPVGLTKQHAGKSHWFFDQINVVIDSSFNVSSITDSSAGRYFPNITNAMTAATFGYGGNTARTGVPNLSGVSGSVMKSTSQYECNTCNTNTSPTNSDQESGAITWGDLA